MPTGWEATFTKAAPYASMAMQRPMPSSYSASQATQHNYARSNAHSQQLLSHQRVAVTPHIASNKLAVWSVTLVVTNHSGIVGSSCTTIATIAAWFQHATNIRHTTTNSTRQKDADKHIDIHVSFFIPPSCALTQTWAHEQRRAGTGTHTWFAAASQLAKLRPKFFSASQLAISKEQPPSHANIFKHFSGTFGDLYSSAASTISLSSISTLSTALLR